MEGDGIVPERRLAIDRDGFEDIMKRRFFWTPAFSIYGGVAGLYDYGPPGTAIKANLLTHWRNYFVLEEDMLEIDATNVTPERVFQISGHTAKFTDLMVRNVETKAFYRADHLLEEHLEKLMADPKMTPERRHELLKIAGQVDDYDEETLGRLLKEFNVRDPEDGGELSEPYPFNLMFETQIGPAGTHKGYLRPETAQGIFCNFAKLLEFNGGRIPFAGATIGTAFRNEIAPRAGVLRVREFQLAEVEHFMDPNDDVHPKFASVADTVLTLFPRDNQTTTASMTQMSIGDAVKKGVVAGENLGYFLARTHRFLLDMGARPEGLRFRQHLANEMAHYATDCWDAELLTSYGWIEVAGHANRSCYDLTVHAAASGVSMHFFKRYDEPVVRDVVSPKPNKGQIGGAFKADAKPLLLHLDTLSSDECAKLADTMDKDQKVTIKVGDKDYQLTSKMIQFVKASKKISGENVTPSVIEPTYGIGRIIYALLEHSYWVRDPEDPTKRLTLDAMLEKKKSKDKSLVEMMRGVLSLSPMLAPTKVSVIPLFSSNQHMIDYIPTITEDLKKFNISSKVDKASQNIGKRYARTDELGIPFGITIDHGTVLDGEPLRHTVTLRERDTTDQIRIPSKEVAEVVHQLTTGLVKWEEVVAKYPKQEASEKDK